MNRTVHIDMLGGFSVTLGLETFTRFRTQRTAALFAYLAFHLKRTHSRDHLAELFWPDSDVETARLNLRVALSSLRQRIDPQSKILLTDRVSVRLAPDALSTDVLGFEAAIQCAKNSRDADQRLSGLRKACASYGGPLLPEFHDEWVSRERSRLAWAYLEAVGNICEVLLKSGDLEEATTYAQLCADEEPFDDVAHERLIRLLLQRGRTVEAADRYEKFRLRLDREVGLKPSASLLALAASLPTPVRSKAVLPKKTSSHGRLPLCLTRFLGREAELRQLSESLTATDNRSRLITIIGAGGCGKTRLLIETAQRLHASFSEGIWFVDLSGLSDARNLPAAIAAALGLQRGPDAEILPRIAQFLSGGALLTLDNMEQLLPEDSTEVAEAIAIVAELLALAPDLSCLVTSRRRIGIEGELCVRIDPLPIPEIGTHPSALASIPSVALFVDRARLAQPDFEITPSNAESIVRLCSRLEGVPLAIELAAAWSHTLSPAEIVEHLSAKDTILANRRRDAPERHRSLRTTIAWSFNLLPPHLRRLLEELSVFRGGWTVEAARAQCTSENVLVDLADLCERSLINIQSDRETKRFTMLESVREFAAESLSREHQMQAAERHAAYFEKFVHEARAHLRTRRQAEQLARLQSEDDNTRAALSWSLTYDPARAAGLMFGLARYWEAMCRDREPCQWFERLRDASIEDPAVRAEAAIAHARFHLREGRFEQAKPLLDTALSLSKIVMRRDLEASAFYGFAHVQLQAGQRREAKLLFERALSIFEEMGYGFGYSDCLINLGELEQRNGCISQARAYWQRALSMSQEHDDVRNLAVVIGNIGEIDFDCGDYSAATTALETVIRISTEASDDLNFGNANYGLGVIELVGMHLDEAGRLLNLSRLIFERIQSRVLVNMAQNRLAEVDFLQGDTKAAESRFREVVESSPQIDRMSTYARLGLASLALEANDTTSAVPHLTECLSLAPERNYAKDTLEIADAVACCLAIAGRIADAAILSNKVESARKATAIGRHYPLTLRQHAKTRDLIEPQPPLPSEAQADLGEIASQALHLLRSLAPTSS